MRSRAAGLFAVLTAASLVFALAAPALAGAAGVAAPGDAQASGAAVNVAATPAGAKAAATERLKLQIAEVLRVRAANFSATTATLNKRIASVSAIATRLEKAGGNVKVARKRIAAAKRHMAKARSLEKQTVAAFKGVVGADNRTAAFAAARAKGKQATTQLKLAQADVRAATVELKKVVRRMNAK